MSTPKGDMPDDITIDGHLFVHVAACPCERIQAEVKRLALPDEESHYSCTRLHCADDDPVNCWAAI